MQEGAAMPKDHASCMRCEALVGQKQRVHRDKRGAQRRLRRKRTAEAARPARAPERAIESETIAVLHGW